MLSTNDIERLLDTIGCTDKHEVQYAIRYSIPRINQYIYVNKQAGSNYSGLVIHPRYQTYRESLKAIPAVQSQNKYHHMSSMVKFPKRQNSGKDEIPYGIPFGFNNEKAFHLFIEKLVSLPKAYSSNELQDIEEAEDSLQDLSPTERESVVSSRIGQGKFRKQLIDLWGSCSVTSCSEISLLKASHIKPWRDSNNKERLDAFNGLLLTPNLDSAFDVGLITFDNNGKIAISSALDSACQCLLGLRKDLRVRYINKENKPYLKYHRKYVFQV